MVFLSDTFTGASGTALESHVGETGATWTEHSSYTAGALVISSANRCRASAQPALCYASGTPAGTAYDVEGIFYVVTVVNSSPTLAGRIDTASDTFYEVRYLMSNTRWELRKIVAGVATLLGSYTQTLSAATSYTVKLEIRNAAKKVYIDGVERISSADNAITAAGRAGVGSRDTQNNATGIHLESVSATDQTEVASRSNRVKVSGSFVDKPVMIKAGGTFTEKPVEVL